MIISFFRVNSAELRQKYGILFNTYSMKQLIYTILKPWKLRQKPSQILYGEYEPQAIIPCELWLGLWCPGCDVIFMALK